MSALVKSNNDAIRSFTDLKEADEHAASSAPRPRLCHLKKWPHFQGYGFNLHAERAKTGQHIGKVDANSPAESAGLKEGDRIIEVNNVNISNENHQQVVKRIRNGLERDTRLFEDEVLLLVLDNEADVYYKSLNVIVNASHPNVLKIYTPAYTIKQEVPVSDDEEEDEDEEENEEPDEDENQEEPYDKNMIDTNNNLIESQLDTDKVLAHELENKLVSNSASSLDKSVSSNNSNETKDNAPAHQQANQSATSIVSKSKEAVSSVSNISVSSNNQSNSSKTATPNTQAKVEKNTYTTKVVESYEADTIYEQHSIERKANMNSTSNNNLNQKKIDPFLQFELNPSNPAKMSFVLSNDSQAANRSKPERPPPPPAQATHHSSMSHSFSGRSLLKLVNGKLSPHHGSFSENKNKLEKCLEMSAAEFKSYLKSKGRPDPRANQVDMKQKFKMFQDM